MKAPLFVAAALISCAAHVQGMDLQGRWEISMPSDQTFSGELVVDSVGRAVCFGASIRHQTSVRSRGYVSRVTDTKAEITLAAGKTVDRIRCVVQSAGVLNCDDIGSGHGVSVQYFMRRIGAGPASLLPQ